MEDHSVYLEEKKRLFQDLYQDAVGREESIHHSASHLVTAEGIVLGTVLIASFLMEILWAETVFDRTGIIVCAGTVFASILTAVLAQWHPGRDSIADASKIAVQMEEAPESFQSHEQRIQYEVDMYQKLSSDVQHTNSILNGRLRASEITFVSGTGLWILLLALSLFGI